MPKSFLQSKQWEQFQRSVGHEVFRADGILLIKKKLSLNRSYFYCPRIIIDGSQGNNQKDIRYRARLRGQAGWILDINNFLAKVRELAKREHAIFLRIEPQEEFRIKNSEFRIIKTTDIQPSKTIVLDVAKSADELLSAMHPKTRYNIRLAEKRGVRVRAGGDSDFEQFWRLMSETTGRDGFRAHGKEYYRKMLTTDGVKLYVADYNRQIIAAGIFIFYCDTVTYLHGASTHEHKEVMAPHALQWEVIKVAKAQGYRYYDLYGIDEVKWPGVTRFKKGFGGKEVTYPGTYDVVFNGMWYSVYELSRRLRRMF